MKVVGLAHFGRRRPPLKRPKRASPTHGKSVRLRCPRSKAGGHGASVDDGMELIHTCHRITDPECSIAFYEALGLEKRRELTIRDEAVNLGQVT